MICTDKQLLYHGIQKQTPTVEQFLLVKDNSKKDLMHVSYSQKEEEKILTYRQLGKQFFYHTFPIFLIISYHNVSFVPLKCFVEPVPSI